MTPEEERRQLAQLEREVADARARLDAGLKYSAEDRSRIRDDLVSAEQRIATRLGEIKELVEDVDLECRQAREAARLEWETIREQLAALAARIGGLDATVAASDKREQRKASTTVAWIGGAFLLLSGLVQTVAELAG